MPAERRAPPFRRASPMTMRRDHDTHALSGSAPAPRPTHAVAPSPRATMSLLFTDIVGSTRQWEQSPGMSERVEAHFDVLRTAVASTGGEIFATMGDGIAAGFTSIDAAVHAAVAAQLAMPAVGVAVRMGVHTGEVERVGDDLRGRALNRAARIMSSGHGGQILLSDVAAALVRNGPNPVALSDLGIHHLRDLVEPERLWQVDHPELPATFPLASSAEQGATNLPVQRSFMVGRDVDIVRVVETLDGFPLVTLTGVGGVGKTRLAVTCAAQLAPTFGRVWFVDLAGLTDPADVADTIAVTIGAPVVTDAQAALAAVLAGERTLLVLDNCEHVIDQAAVVVDALLSSCPALSIIATSREPLGVEGEFVVPVRPLDLPVAVALFRRRANAAGADLLSTRATTLDDICRRLDGIPLAIELVAARTATLGVPAVLAALESDGLVLDARRARGDARQETMRSTIEWSYRLLSPTEQLLFRWLAVFRSGVEHDGVRHVAATIDIDPALATDVLSSLVHKSLLTPEVRERGVRYRMLETVRTFALELLDDARERTAAGAAHAEWMATITDLPYADPCSALVGRRSLRLEREADNWRDAVRFAAEHRLGDLAGRLCGPPVAYFLLGRHDLADAVRPLLDLCDGHDQRSRGVLCALIVSASGATDPSSLQAWTDEIRAIDEREPTGLVGLMQWMVLAWSGDFAAAVEVCVEASLDERYRQDTRDMFVGIAVLDHFSLLGATDDPHGLLPRALDVAARSDVALNCVSCLLGAAWGLAGTAPDESLRLVRRALASINDVPALTRLTLPGSASRLLTQLDPRVAARGLLEQLDAIGSHRTYVDLIPLFYAAELLQGLGHDGLGPTLEHLTVSPIAPYLSMMDFVDLARRAFAASNPVPLGELERVVRRALADLVAGVPVPS
jgi:predicted ATPase/class 3 adenylate cyclase